MWTLCRCPALLVKMQGEEAEGDNLTREQEKHRYVGAVLRWWKSKFSWKEEGGGLGLVSLHVAS